MLEFFKLGRGEKEEKVEESPVVKEITERLSYISSTTVKEIMVPRIDVVSISINSSIQEIIDVIIKEGHSRIPVWEKSVDDVIGILYAKDLFQYFFQEEPEIDLREILREPHFIPESKRISSLLKEFQQSKNHLAVVVDEYGGVSGIVALEDVLEEIVGEIQDEYDEEEELISELTQYVYMIDSRTNVEDVNIALELELPTDISDTIGGLVFDLFGKVPEQNEAIDYDGIEFRIDSIEGNKLEKIKLTIKDADKKKLVKENEKKIKNL